jgi:hypothetical protein
MFALLAGGALVAIAKNTSPYDTYKLKSRTEEERRVHEYGLNVRVFQNADYLTWGQKNFQQLDFYKKPRSFDQVAGEYSRKVEGKNKLIDHLFKERNPVFSQPVENFYRVIPNFIVPFFDELAVSPRRPPLIDEGGRTF